MIFRSVVFSLILGCLAGTVSSFSHLAFILVDKIKRRLLHRDISAASKPHARHIFDFLFALFVGISYLLIVYTFTDGAFYVISLLSLFCGFAFAKCLIKYTLKLFKTTKR